MEIQQGKRYEALGDGTSRADVLLAAASGLSRSRVAALMEQGCCTLQGAPLTKPGTKPAAGALLTLLEPPPREARPQAENIDLEILYQDEDLAVVVKPCGMVVHPPRAMRRAPWSMPCCITWTAFRALAGEIRPGIVHRLDKDTSGLLLVAKNDFAHGELSRQLAAREMEKHYRALVEGVMKEDAGEVTLPLGRSKTDRKKMAVDPQGRDALTRWAGAGPRPGRHAAGCAHPHRAYPSNPRTYAGHSSSRGGGPTVRHPPWSTGGAADAPRLFPGLYAPAHGKAYGVYRPLAGGFQPGVALRRASRDR